MRVEESTGIQIPRQRCLGHIEEVCTWDQYVGLDGRIRGQRVPVGDGGPDLGHRAGEGQWEQAGLCCSLTMVSDLPASSEQEGWGSARLIV